MPPADRISVAAPGTEPSPDDLAATALAAARAAGEIQRRAFGDGAPAEAAGPRDVKLAVDRACERAVAETIRLRFPSHRILSEEGGDLGGTDDHLWIVDPLDGTVNFFHGLPQFCACVACCRLPAGAPLPATGADLIGCTRVGVVLAPLLDEAYVAVADRGATCNGRPIDCGRPARLAETIVGLSFGKTEAGIDRMSRLCAVLARRARKLRSFGSAGHDLALVAAGRLGGLLYRGVQIWDIAAAGLVLVEAGGVLTAERMADGTWDLVAAAGGVHAELLALAAEA